MSANLMIRATLRLLLSGCALLAATTNFTPDIAEMTRWIPSGRSGDPQFEH